VCCGYRCRAAVYESKGKPDAAARCKSLAHHIGAEIERIDLMLAELPKMPIPARVP
jgi:hypothetical protein